LPWNQGKTWAGFLAFIINGSLMAGWIYWGETQNPESLEAPLSMGRALLLTSPAVVLCAIVESVPSKINDNVRVGIVGSISLLLLSGMR
jgi:dolichol kinase